MLVGSSRPQKRIIQPLKEGLALVCARKKFWHYLLANNFVFFVNHQALLYLVNKPCSTRKLVWWFVILLEFDFTMDVKKGSTHTQDNHMSYIENGEPPHGVNDELSDVVK